MILKAQVIRVLGAAVLLIALSLVPSMANAHAGHAHALSPAASATQLGDAGMSSGTVAAIALKAEFSAGGITPDRPLGSACGGGCCSGAPCTACVGMVLIELPGIGLPISAASIVMIDIWPTASRDPEGLRKPPKSFA